MKNKRVNFYPARCFEEIIGDVCQKRTLHRYFSSSVEYFNDICEFANENGIDAYFAIEGGGLIVSTGCSLPEIFFFPKPLFKGFSLRRALEAIKVYCKENSAIRVISDIPADKLGEAMRGVRHGKIDDIGEGCYSLTVETECMLARYAPEVNFEEVNLSEPTLYFAEEYRRLIFDEETNKYTGYDLRREMKDTEAEYFVEEVRDEFRLGSALTLFATVLSEQGNNIFIGEGVFYSFDGEGEAEIAIKILPEYRGVGLGRKLLFAMLEAARAISLTKIKARVIKDNISSVKLFSSVMQAEGKEEDVLIYSLNIE